MEYTHVAMYILKLVNKGISLEYTRSGNCLTDHEVFYFRYFRDSVETPLTLIQSGMNPIGTLHAFSVSSHPRTASHPNS